MLRIDSTTKNLLVTFLFLIESVKQMLHGVYPEIAEGFSMTQQQTPDGPKSYFFLTLFEPLRENPMLVAVPHPRAFLFTAVPLIAKDPLARASVGPPALPSHR